MLDPLLMMAVLSGGGLGAAVVLLIAGLRGVQVDATRPTPSWQRAVTALRSPAVGARFLLALGASAGTLTVTRWPVAALAIGGLVLSAPQLFGGARVERLSVARLEALAIWTESMRDRMSANMSLEEAIPASIARSPLLIRPSLTRLAGQLRLQTPLDDALLDLAADLADPEADQVIAALLLNSRRRGDGLARVLTGLSRATREELELRRQISAGRAGPRRGVQIITFVTVLIVGYLSAFGGTYLAPYDSLTGQLALTIVIGLFATGLVWIRRLAAGKDGEPWLAKPGDSPDPAHLQIVAALTAVPLHNGGFGAPQPNQSSGGTSR